MINFGFWSIGFGYYQDLTPLPSYPILLQHAAVAEQPSGTPAISWTLRVAGLDVTSFSHGREVCTSQMEGTFITFITLLAQFEFK